MQIEFYSKVFIRYIICFTFLFVILFCILYFDIYIYEHVYIYEYIFNICLIYLCNSDSSNISFCSAHKTEFYSNK